SFPIEMFADFVRIHGHLCATVGNVCMTAPKNGVGHEASKVVVGPVLVRMAAREAETSTAIRALESPRDDLFASRIVLGFGVSASVVWRSGLQDRRDVLQVRNEFHVVVPLIANLKRANAARDGMIGQRREIGVPMGIDGNLVEVIAAHPVKDALAA